MNEEQPRGWVKPQRERTLDEVKELIATRRKELAALELEAYNLQQGPRLEAIAKIRNIMRAQQISVDEIQVRSRKARQSTVGSEKMSCAAATES